MLEVRRVTHGYDSITVLSDLSFQIPAGKFVCIVGPNGCGKTTLLRLIAGLVRPTRGEILLNGQPIQEPGPERGFVFQEYALFPWRSVRKNIEFGLEMRGIAPRARREIGDKYLDLVGLRGFEDYNVRRLSGGMKQKVSIARALADEPVVILMDEPFTALDCQTRNVMQEEPLNIWDASRARKTILFVTHNVEEAVFLADVVLMLSHRPGRLLETIPVDLPRPRDRVGPELHRLRGHILDLLAAQMPKTELLQETCEVIRD
jgi:ABC-type nitrate/sulfonate/bicarbonate transport system ATPase subunit